MVFLYGFVFLDARLYSDALLQVFYLLIQVYGWVKWLQSRELHGTVFVERMTGKEIALWGGVIVAATLAEGYFLANYTRDAAPWLDATITALSVVAQYLLSIRRLESWLL